MINTARFIKMIRNTEKINIKKIGGEKNFSVVKGKYNPNRKKFSFASADKKLEFYINNLRVISRLTSEPNKYIFYVELNGGERYEFELFMKEGTTPFVITDYEKKQTKAIQSAIPKYLDILKGKQIVVSRTSKSELFSTWNVDDNMEEHIVTDCYILSNFDYDTEIVEGTIVLKLFDKSNSRIYSTVLSTQFVIGGNKKNKNKTYIGGKNGEFILTTVD